MGRIYRESRFKFVSSVYTLMYIYTSGVMLKLKLHPFREATSFEDRIRICKCHGPPVVLVLVVYGKEEGAGEGREERAGETEEAVHHRSMYVHPRHNARISWLWSTRSAASRSFGLSVSE